MSLVDINLDTRGRRDFALSLPTKYRSRTENLNLALCPRSHTPPVPRRCTLHPVLLLPFLRDLSLSIIMSLSAKFEELEAQQRVVVKPGVHRVQCERTSSNLNLVYTALDRKRGCERLGAI